MVIKLNHSAESIIDDEDYVLIKDFSWHLTSKGYATASRCHKDKLPSLLMHRVIMQPPYGMDVDHINGNKLDNRRSNLRICTRSQNLRNQYGKPNRKSDYKGVYASHGDKFRALIYYGEKLHYLGTFDTQEEAALAYNAAAVKNHKQFARLNIIKDRLVPVDGQGKARKVDNHGHQYQYNTKSAVR